MGCVVKLVNAIVFLFFILKAIVGPLFDAQFCIPQEYHPQILVDFSSWYVGEIGDYMVVDKPNFYVGFAWLELCVLWPLCISNLYGMIYAKSWFKTTCLIHGVILTTTMVGIISEIIGSDKSSEKLKMVYYFFMGQCMLVAIRGFFSCSFDNPCVAQKSRLEATKKRD